MGAVTGAPVDRPPISFWGHFYHRESTAQDLVEATLEFEREYDWDWVKLNPRKHYHVEPWGVGYRYSGRAAEKPVLETWPVHQPGDWAAIGERPGDAGALAEQLEAVRALRAALPDEVPLIETVFTPLAVLGEMVEEPGTLRLHMRTQPNAVRGALEAVTRTFETYVTRLVAERVDGIYLATVDWASRNLMTPEDYREWARPYDLRILARAGGLPFNVLHVCKRRNLLLEFADYPVAAFSYDATDPTNPPIQEALARLPGAFMGGISHEDALQARSTDRVLDEFRRAQEITGGRRWLAAPGCSIPPATPAANLKAVRAAADAIRLPQV
ncbi:MAG: uroporphyrinogen decarboxylase family protein [Candidatus Eisenbacteria bacterium]